MKERNFQFQQKWFEKYTWLHFDTASGRVLCHICATAKQDNVLDAEKRANDSFLPKGFKNWKKGIETFDAHKRSNKKKEEFLGLYNIESTSGLSISAMILDVLIRLQLPIQKLKSQTYDGAANMAGKFHGCQAKIKKHQPLARFVNCGAHVT